MCSLLQRHSPVLKCLLCSWEIFPPNYSRFHLQEFVNWRHLLFPVGTAVAASRIFPINFSISFNDIPLVMRTILCSSALIKLCLSCASLIHRVAPSTIQPSTSFLTVHWPSPHPNFFLDIGSCLLWPEICGGVNIRWIPCINALEKRSNCFGSLVCAMCINCCKVPPACSKTVFLPIELKTYYTCFTPTCLHFRDRIVLILCFPLIDALSVYQHVSWCMIPLRHVLFLMPHGISKETMSIPFAERTVLPTQLVLLDDLAEQRKSSILTQLHTPFYRTHI